MIRIVKRQEQNNKKNKPSMNNKITTVSGLKVKVTQSIILYT